MTDRTRNPVDWAIQALEEAGSVEEIRTVLKGSVRAGVRAQGATVVHREDDQCFYVDEDAMSPLWKGQRFPVRACISGWAMLNEQTVAIADIRADSRVPQEAYRPTFVRSMVAVPIRVGHPIGAIGAYWASPHRATDEEIATLEALAEAAGRALGKISSSPGTAVGAASPSSG